MRVDRNDRSVPWGWPAAIVAVVVVALVVRALHLTGFQGLTEDEGFTVALAQRSLPHMLHLYTFEGNGFIYSLLEWPLVRIQDSVLVLRLPALVAGVLTVAALYWTALRMAGRSAALVAAGLLAVNPLAVVYSQYARPYVFAMLFGTVAYGCLARMDDGRRYRVAYVVAMALATYSNALALVLLPAQGLWLLHDRRLPARWLRSLLWLALAVAPLVALLLVERSKRSPLYWLSKPNVHTLSNFGTVFMGGRGSLLLGAVVVAGAVGLRHGRSHDLLGVGAWALVPPLLVFAASQVSPIFLDSYLLPALPGAVLLVATAATRLPRAPAIVVVVLFAVLFARQTLSHAGAYHPHGWQLAARTLASERHADPVLFDIPDGLVADGFYDSSLAARDGRLVVNEWDDEPLPAGVTLRDDTGGYSRAPVGPPSRRLLARLAKKTGTEFVMASGIFRQGAILQSPGLRWAAEACSETTTRFVGVELIRITRCRSETSG